jgi:Putative transmembrane protein (Alph_Pro_TM)
VLGIWVNTAARTFVDPPSYLAVLASRPLDAITNAANQRRLRIGIANTPLPELIHNDIGEVANDPFRAAVPLHRLPAKRRFDVAVACSAFNRKRRQEQGEDLRRGRHRCPLRRCRRR